ncbi:MAG: DUF169 domain-containing protein [Bacillota bacterium]
MVKYADKLAAALGLAYNPVAVFYSETPPEGAMKFKRCGAGCVLALFKAVQKDMPAVVSAEAYGCYGGGFYLGYRDTIFDNFPAFLSTGLEGRFEGEGFKKTPALAEVFFEEAAKRPPAPHRYCVFKPLSQLAPGETPEVVIYLVNADQLSALVTLANYARPSNDNVIVRFAAGCQSLVALPRLEARREIPRAVIGLVDVSTRHYFPPDTLSFSVPYSMYLELLDNVAGSFLEKPDWLNLKRQWVKESTCGG